MLNKNIRGKERDIRRRTPRVVSIAGGTGQSEILRGLKGYDVKITAIVAVTDSGRSTGVIRKNYDIPAPGDLRNCLVALADSEPLLTDLFQYRFEKGKDLKGMSFGNLFLTALTKVKGDMHEAVKEMSKILKIRGKVYPSTTSNTHICAEFEDGTIVQEEFNVRTLGKSPIRKIFLKDKDVKAGKEVIKAIKNADIMIIGPGSLYTSILANFLVPNLRDSVKKSKAKKVLVANMITQAGQTDNYPLSKHISEAERYIGKDVLDYVLVNKSRIPKEIISQYEKEGGHEVVKDLDKVKKSFPKLKIIEKDVMRKDKNRIVEWDKVSSLRHDPKRTIKAIFDEVRKDIGHGAKSRSDVKAVILAAGNSTRLRPFSFTESKTMMRFLGKPLLAYHVDECISNGIEDIIIVCNKQNNRYIREYFKCEYLKETKQAGNTAHKKRPRIRFAVQKEQSGPANAVYSAKRFFMGKKDDMIHPDDGPKIIIKYGDSISTQDETGMILKKFYEDEAVDTVITLRKVDDPREYGIARFSTRDAEKRVVEIVEKPKDSFPSGYANVGLCIIDGNRFVKAYERMGDEKVIPPQEYILKEGGKASHWITTAKRLDLGRAWNILEANKLMIDKYGGKVESNDVQDDAKISETSYVSEDSVIAKNVRIEGYSSVSGFVGEGTVIRDSVIMEGTKIAKRCIIDSSVIGKNNFIDTGFRTLVDGNKGSGIKVYVKGRYVNPTMKKVGIFTGENVTIKEGLKSLPGKMIFPNKTVSQDIKEDKLIRAILFDADNTIYRTRDVSRKADMEAMRTFVKKNPKKTPGADELYKTWKDIVSKVKEEKDPKKRSRNHSYALLSERFGLKGKREALVAFKRTLLDSITLMEGFEKNLKTLSGYKLAVMTEDGSDLTMPKLENFGLRDIFDLIVTSDNIGEMKPTPKYYKTIFRRFGVEPNECLVIGDDFDKDLKIAKDMGATTISFGKADKRADYSIYSHSELPEILGKI